MPPRAQGGVKRVPPTEISCDACGHQKHPRSLKCKEPGCQCECLKQHVGVKRKRKAESMAKGMDEAGTETHGGWRMATHKKVVHQASFAAGCMFKSRAVYAVLCARFCENQNAVVTETWGSEPWVAGELLGKTGVLEILFRQHASRHIGSEPLDGLGDYDKVLEVLRQVGLGALFEQFISAKFDAASFVALGKLDSAFADVTLRTLGVNAAGDRLKLIGMAKRYGEGTPGGGRVRE